MSIPYHSDIDMNNNRILNAKGISKYYINKNMLNGLTPEDNPDEIAYLQKIVDEVLEIGISNSRNGEIFPNVDIWSLYSKTQCKAIIKKLVSTELLIIDSSSIHYTKQVDDAGKISINRSYYKMNILFNINTKQITRVTPLEEFISISNNDMVELDYLSKTAEEEDISHVYTPTKDYQPATKKYSEDYTNQQIATMAENTNGMIAQKVLNYGADTTYGYLPYITITTAGTGYEVEDYFEFTFMDYLDQGPFTGIATVVEVDEAGAVLKVALSYIEKYDWMQVKNRNFTISPSTDCTTVHGTDLVLKFQAGTISALVINVYGSFGFIKGAYICKDGYNDQLATGFGYNIGDLIYIPSSDYSGYKYTHIVFKITEVNAIGGIKKLELLTHNIENEKYIGTYSNYNMIHVLDETNTNGQGRGAQIVLLFERVTIEKTVFDIKEKIVDINESINDIQNLSDETNSILDKVNKQLNEFGGTYRGIFNTYADLQSAISTDFLGSIVNLNDFVVVKEDENHDNKKTRYYAKTFTSSTTDSTNSFLTCKLGDIDRNGIINSFDHDLLNLIYSFYRNKETNTVETLIADINQDGKISLLDKTAWDSYFKGSPNNIATENMNKEIYISITWELIDIEEGGRC